MPENECEGHYIQCFQVWILSPAPTIQSKSLVFCSVFWKAQRNEYLLNRLALTKCPNCILISWKSNFKSPLQSLHWHQVEALNVLDIFRGFMPKTFQLQYYSNNNPMPSSLETPWQETLNQVTKGDKSKKDGYSVWLRSSPSSEKL